MLCSVKYHMDLPGFLGQCVFGYIRVPQKWLRANELWFSRGKVAVGRDVFDQTEKHACCFALGVHVVDIMWRLAHKLRTLGCSIFSLSQFLCLFVCFLMFSLVISLKKKN